MRVQDSFMLNIFINKLPYFKELYGKNCRVIDITNYR